MSLFNNSLLLGADAAAGGYQITRSLRFNSADSAYASRVAGTPTTSGTWTLSVWVKRAALGGDYALFGANASSTYTQIYFKSDNTIRWYENGGDINGTAAVFRDVSAWSHLVFRRDGTSSMKIYHNGVEISQTTSSIPSSSPFNSSGATIYIGRAVGSGFDSYANSYLSDIHFIDGQALTPSDFGETDTNGVWQPKAYTGSYGTNGFRLDFVDNSSTTALGYDAAGSNDWTPNNLSVTAGVGNDSLVDSPTNYGTDTGAGGEVRGNYCTLNPLFSSTVHALSDGNLRITGTGSPSGYGITAGTIGMSSGKWYWEQTLTSFVGPDINLGIGNKDTSLGSYIGATSGSYGFSSNNTKWNLSLPTSAAYTTSWVNGDIIGLAFDADAGSLTLYKNGVSLGVAFSGIPADTYFPMAAAYQTTSVSNLNFGQRPFAYTAPSGFKALCTQNLPEGTITTSGSFTGNANADGPFIWLNGVPTAMTINSNAVTFGTHADKLSNGFKVRTSSTSYNTSGSNTYSITTTGDKFKYARAQPNP